MDILAFLGAFIVYLLAFALGSVLAAFVAKRLYPAQSEDEALALLDRAPQQNGVTR